MLSYRKKEGEIVSPLSVFHSAKSALLNVLPSTGCNRSDYELCYPTRG